MITSIVIALIIILIVVVVAVIIIDKTFTGEAAQFAWIAKIIVGLIALVAVVNMLSGAGLLHF